MKVSLAHRSRANLRRSRVPRRSSRYISRKCFHLRVSFRRHSRLRATRPLCHSAHTLHSFSHMTSRDDPPIKDTSPVSFTTASTSTHSAEVKSVLPRSIDLALLPRCVGSGERGSQLGDAVPVPGTKGGRCEPTPSGFDLVFRVSPRRDARLHAYGSRVLHTVLY